MTVAMGNGHDRVADELRRRLAARGAEVVVVDLFDAMPLRTGKAISRFYAWMLMRAPWAYEAIYRVFFVPRQPVSVSRISPGTVVAGRTLGRIVARERPDVVVATFHMVGQAAGWLRQRGAMAAPAVTFVTDFAVHQLWQHPGTDLYLCVHPVAAAQVTAGGARALAPRPVVEERFRAAPDRERIAALRAEFGLRDGEHAVLVSSGGWGTGDVETTARTLARSGRYRPIVLCARNAALRERLAGEPGAIVLGWRDDMPDLMALADVLVENAAGLTCLEAMAAGLPVLSYRPIPGHGRDSAQRMAEANVSLYPRDDAALFAALDRLCTPGPARDGHVAAGRALFGHGDAADDVLAAIEGDGEADRDDGEAAATSGP